MSKFTIYSKDNVARRESLTGTTGNDGAIVYGEGLEYNGSWMGECFITVTIHSAYPVNFQMGDYITYRGEKFVLNYDPSVVKKARRGTYGEGFTYDSIKFNSLGTELTDVNFLDYVLGDNSLHYTSLPTFPFHAATIDDYCDRLQANTNRWCEANGFYIAPDGSSTDYWLFLTPNKNKFIQRASMLRKNGNNWIGLNTNAATEIWEQAYGEGTNVSDEKKDVHVEVSNETVWNALTRIKNDFGLNFINRDRKVIVGSAGLPTSVFSYGKGNGLYEIERVADSEQAVITKLFAYGSEKNMPVRYYANLNASIFGYMYGREDATNNVIYLNVRYSTSYLTTSDGSGKYNVTVKIGNTSYSAKVYSTQVGSQGLLLTISPATSGAWSSLTITSSTKIYFTAGVKIDSWTGQTETNSDMPNNMAVNRLMLPGFPNQSLYAWVLDHGGTEVRDENNQPIIYKDRNNNDVAGLAEWTYNNVTYTAYFSMDALQPYILSVNFTELGVREASKLFDGSDDTEEIYPTIEGTGLDIIASAEVITDNGVFTEGEDEPEFDIYLPDFGSGFDLAEQAKQGTQDGGTPTIFMKSGYCGSREFSFTADDAKQETSGAHSGQWKVRAKREHDDLLDLYFPYSYGVSTGQQATANEAYQVRGDDVLGTGNGDKYVLTGIPMTSTYVDANAQKLLGYSLAFLAKNDYTRYTFTPRVDEIFMARDHETNGNNSIYSKIKEGDLMQFEEADFGIETGSVFIDTLSIKEDGNNGVPTFDVTLRNDKQVGTIQRIQNKIDSVAASIATGGFGLDTAQVRELINSYGATRFLSKLNNDTAQGFITFIQGLQVGNQFVSGLLGEGGIFNKDTNGKTYIETDKLYVRMKAYFDTVEIRKYLHSGGNRIASVAGVKVVRVEGLNSSGNVATTNIVKYRCYFRGSDGDAAVSNDFVIGDQVYCHITNVTSGSSLYQHHYWRLCVGKSSATNSNGEHYIDLSNKTSETISGVAYSGYQTDSDVPLEQDDIIQLGNVNDSDRRGAVVEYVSGNNAPSYQVFQDLGDIGTASTIAQKQAAQYSLEGKNYIGLGYDSSTGRAYMNVYGDFYFGSKDGTTTYIKYNSGAYNAQTNPDGGKLQIKAIIDATSPISGTSSDITTLGGILNNLQSQIDGSIETLYGDVDPSIPVNDPYKDYTTAEKEKHLGDMYYNSTTGYAYRYDKTVNGSTTTYGWTIIRDTGITQAIAEAAAAYNLAGTKAKIYVTTTGTLPPKPYNKEDLWVNATGTWDNITYDNDILKCITACDANGTPSISHWTKASKYTDDTALHNYIAALLGKQTYASGDDVVAATVENAIRTALGGSTIIDGGLMLTSLLALRKLNPNGDPSDVNDYTTWAGISGVYDSQLTTGGIAAWYGGDQIDYESLTDRQKDAGWGTDTNQTRFARSLFRFDGSGYLANGNITWDKLGNLGIKYIYSDASGTTYTGDVLNSLATFNKAFGFTLDQSGNILRIVPSYSFSTLKLVHESGYTITDTDVVSYGELKNMFVTKSFFEDIFKPEDSSGNRVTTNGSTSTINRLKILVGAYTDQYLSALGLNPNSGGGGGATTLADLLDTEITNPTDGQILKYVVSNNIGKWVNAAPPETYTLPTASTSTKGGVKVGTTLAISSAVLDLASVTLGTPASGDTTYTKVVVDSYGRISKATTLAASDIPDISSTYATSGRVTTLEGYFTSGVAKSAAKLSTVSKTLWGNTYWTSGGVPTSIGTSSTPASLSYVTNIDSLLYFDTTNSRIGIGTNSPSYKLHVSGTLYASGNSSIGGTFGVTGATTLSSSLSVASGITLTTTKKITFGTETNAPYIEVDSNGYFHFSAGLYSDSFVSALGLNDSGSGGGGGAGDVTWDALASSNDTRPIALSHLTDALATYATQSWVGNNYLPLSGGTMTGSIVMGTNHYIYGVNETKGAIIYFDGTKTIVGSCGTSSTSATLLRSSTNHLLVGGSGSSVYTVWDSGNDGASSGLDADLLDGYHAIGAGTGNIIKQGYINIGGYSTDKWFKIASFPKNTQYLRTLLYVTTFYVTPRIGTENGSCIFEVQTRHDSTYFIHDIKGLAGNLPASNLRLYYNTANDAMEVYMLFPTNSSQANRTVVTRVLAETKRQAQSGDDVVLVNNQAIEPTDGWSYEVMTYKRFLGNSASSTKLETARTIWGQSFNGTANVSGNLYMIDPNAANSNQDSSKLKFACSDTDDKDSQRAPYIQALKPSSNNTYGRKRLGFFTSNAANFTDDFVEALSITPDANVGIGTTSPSEKLEINEGSILLSGGADGRSFRIGYGGTIFFRATTTNGWSGGLAAYTNDGSTLLGQFGYYGIADTLTYMFVGGAYNHPWVEFLESGMTIRRETTTANDSPASINFEIKDTTTGKTYSNAFIRCYQDHASTPNGMNMVIRPGGNLFLGGGEAASAHYALKVGSTTENTYITSDNFVYIQANGNTIANRKGIYISTSGIIYPCAADTATNAAASLGTSSYRFNEICGTTLNISGNITTSGSVYVQGSNAGCTVSYDGISMGAGSYTVSLKYESNDKLKITAGTTYTTGGFYSNSYVSALGQNTSSDIRKKNVMGNVELDIEDIASAPSVKYLWKDKDLGLQAGSIAQYWQNVLPECVHTDTDGYLSMEYGVIALLASIATAKKVKDHEKEIADLRNRVRELETEVEQLKA